MDADLSSPHTSQLKTIVTLFVIMRVTIVLMYTPQGLLNAYTDFQYYYRVAQAVRSRLLSLRQCVVGASGAAGLHLAGHL